MAVQAHWEVIEGRSTCVQKALKSAVHDLGWAPLSVSQIDDCSEDSVSQIRVLSGINNKPRRITLRACDVPGALVAARQARFALQGASTVRSPDIEVGSRTDGERLSVWVILTLEPQRLADAPSLVQDVDDLTPTARSLRQASLRQGFSQYANSMRR